MKGTPEPIELGALSVVRTKVCGVVISTGGQRGFCDSKLTVDQSRVCYDL